MKSFLFGFIVFIFFTSVVTSCKPISTDFTIYQVGVTTPIVVIPSKPKGIELKAKDLFIQEFNLVTGVTLKVIAESAYQSNDKIPAIFIGNTQNSIQYKATYHSRYDGFCIGHKDNKVFITAREGLGILNGVTSFFELFAQTTYIDNNEKISSRQELIKIPANTITQHEPAFSYRQAYFPQSLDYNYTIWNKTHLIDEYWAVWGHHLDKLINFEGLSTDQKNDLYATNNAVKTQDQYCFSSEILYTELVKGIENKKALQPDAIYYSIAPNDNAIVCSCERCKKIHNDSKSSSNSVALLINRLATRFPELIFTSHAYSSTINPPTNLQFKSNVIILLSTIDFPKGQALSKSKQADNFKKLCASWQNVCKKLYIWDYTIQYTNYYDFFPNLKALKEDLHYFKELGIKGVLEQGSEDQYCLFGEWKSYAISKLLWNPNLNLDSLQYAFFEKAYPSHVDLITDFLTQLENNLKKSGKALNIYGTIKESLQNYISNEQFDLFFYELQEKYAQTNGNEQIRLQKALTALVYDKLEMMRSEGVDNYGYGTLVGDSIKINPEVPKLLKQLADFSSKTNVTRINENGDSIQRYINLWYDFIINPKLKSKLIGKPINILSKSNGEYIGNAAQALNDACIGFLDFEVNWLIFNNTNVEIEIPSSSYIAGKQLSLSFLNDPRHVILYPSKVEVYSVRADGVKTKLDEKLIEASSVNKTIKTILLSLQKQTNPEKLYILITAPTELQTSGRKPSIACDEIFIY